MLHKLVSKRSGAAALRIARPRSRASTDFDWTRDYPTDLQDRQANGETTVRLTFALNQQDCVDIANETGRHITESLPIELSFGPRHVRFRVPKRRWGHELSKQVGPIAQFISSRARFEYIPAVRTHHNATRVIDDILSMRLAVLEEQPEYVQALDTIRRLQEPVLAQVSEEMTSTLKVFLPAVTSVRVELSQDHRYQRLRESSDIIVDDGVATSLSSKGDGVISLAAIGLMRLGVARGRARQAILAIEEPESHLHPQAVHLLRDAMNDIAKNQQVILTTHSPLFVDRSVPSANVIVQANTATVAQGLKAIRDSLGVRVHDNLFNAETVLFVEGPHDLRAIVALVRWRSPVAAKALDDGRLAIQALGGCSKLPASVYAVERQVMNWHCLLDNDKVARECFLRLVDERMAKPIQATFTTLGKESETEIEDWYRIACYEAPLSSQYGNLTASSAFTACRGKWSVRMQSAFQAAGQLWQSSEFDVKRLVAECVAASPQSALRREAEGPFQSVVDRLEALLV
jgi:putative ATP-dependent endonuclease of OLD family